jgi:integrase/recombinase XerD
MFMLAGAMKAKNTNQTKNKSTRKNNAAALASSEWYQEFVRFVELRDIAPRTRVSYLAWVRRLHEARPGRDITTLSEGEALDFLIALRHERGLKDSTVNQAACALRGFFRDHLGRDWKAWSKIKIRREEQLPNVLSRDEVAKFLGAVRVGRFRAMFTLMYHCGLRLGEVIRLKPGHIDGKRRVLRVVGGKGAKDRDIPLSDELLARLRAFWKQHRNPEWMFPAPGRGWMTAGSTLGQALHRSDRHLSDSAVQAAMRATVLSLGWDKRHGKRPVTCHTLRHCFATHLLDAGVSVRLVSQYLGHSSLKPTLVYLHLTEVSESAAREVIAKFPGL